MGGPCGVGQDDLASLVRRDHQVVDGEAKCGLGQIGQHGGHARLAPNAPDVGNPRRKRDLPFGVPHGAGELRTGCGRTNLRQRRERARDDGAGSVMRNGERRRVFPKQQVRQIRTAAAECRKHRGAAGLGSERRFRIPQRREALGQALGGGGVGRRGP